MRDGNNPNLLVLGSSDVGGVRISSSAGNVAEFAAKLVLSVSGQRASSTAAAAAALRHLQRSFLLLVLLAFQMLLVGLMLERRR